MENKVIYRIEADFEGFFFTDQKDIVPFNIKQDATSENFINIYRGHVRNVRILDDSENFPSTELEFWQVQNIQIEPGGQWPFSIPRIFDFYEFKLDNVKFGQPHFPEGIYSSKSRDNTYCEIKGKLYGSILERRIIDNNENPPKEEECKACSQPVDYNGGYGIYKENIRLGKESGKTYIKFNPLYRVDRLEIFYKGARVWSTHQIEPNVDGFVGGDIDKQKGYANSSTIKWGTFDYRYDGEESVLVVVTGKEKTTQWSYTLFCPNVVPPDAVPPDNTINDETQGPDKDKKPFPKPPPGCLNWLWWLLLILFLLFLLKQCTTLGEHAKCWYEKNKSETRLKEYDQELAETENEIKDTEVDVEPCQTVKAEGKSVISERYFDLGKTPGKVSIEYDMYQAEDMIEVFYDGELVGSSNGFVSGSGIISFVYNPEKGRPTEFMVKLSPGPIAQTEWNYNLICPE